MSALHKKSQRLSRYNLTRTTCICMLVMAERYNLLYELVREPKVVQRGRHHPTPPSFSENFMHVFLQSLCRRLTWIRLSLEKIFLDTLLHALHPHAESDM